MRILLFIAALLALYPALAEASSTRATQAAFAPKIDGVLDDAVWRSASWFDQFVQQRPNFGKPATYETSFAVVYTDKSIYFAVRALTPHPEKIVDRLTRRDRYGDFDTIEITLSPRNDGLTGYGFNVSASGVKRDMSWSNDGTADASWDAVWAAETSKDSRGWYAEIALPLDQIRFTKDTPSWGLQITRWIPELREHVSFHPIPPEASGWISTCGTLEGVAALEPKNPFAATPEVFVAYQDSTEGYGSRTPDGIDWDVGANLKIGLAPDFVLDVALNPDFAQVELDQAIVNLSAYETFYLEKRPFFLEGASVFKTPLQLFYSRRLGGAPSDPALGVNEELVTGPNATPILFATKLVGRTSQGLTLGFIESVLMPTEFQIKNLNESTLESAPGTPWTNASVIRVSQEPFKGSKIGVLATALNPDQSKGSYAGGIDWDLESSNKLYAFSGQLAGNKRYGGIWGKDPAEGLGFKGELARRGGEHFRAWLTYHGLSEDFDLNDLGYLARGNKHAHNEHLQWRKVSPSGPFDQLYFGLKGWGGWNTDGLNLGQGGETYLRGVLKGGFTGEFGAWAMSSRYDDIKTRGGPPMSEPTTGGAWTWFHTPGHKPVGGSLVFSWADRPFGYRLKLHPSIAIRLGRLELEIGPRFTRTIGDHDYVATITPATEELTIIGRRDLDELNLTLKGTLVILRDLTFQFTGQALAVAADYSHYEQLLDDSSTQPYDYPDQDADFATADLRIQALLRWEYLPGSTLFLVYSHLGFGQGDPADHTLSSSLQSLKDEERIQLLMLKLSHRFG